MHLTDAGIREYHVLNLGAGVQSTTLYLMFLRGEITPQIDAAIFADTGDEPRKVYEHLEWLKALNGPWILVRSKGTISADLMKGQNSDGQKFMGIPAYTPGPDGTGKGRRQCSFDYKIEVINQTIRRELCGAAPGRAPVGFRIHQYYGISFDERGRAKRIAEAKRPRYIRVHFPLVERAVTRATCLEYLKDKVPHETPRSACWHCPFHSDAEWARQKAEDPESWAKSVALDYALRDGRIVNRRLDQQWYLHSSCVPLELVELNPKPNVKELQLGLNFQGECLGVCGV